MSRGLIVYFSQGGTTKQVAESIAIGLRSAGQEVDLHNLVDGPPPDLHGYGLLGVGSPAYYFRPPFSVMDYVLNLPDLGRLPTFVFVLYGSYFGDAGNDIWRALARKHAREVGYFKSRGADYFVGYLNQGYLFSPDNPDSEELAQAVDFGQEVATRLAGGEAAGVQDDPAPGALYRLERFLVGRWFVEQMYSRLFRVERDKCTGCGVCLQMCPSGNISEDGEGRPVWGRDCLLCLYCELNCPEGAVSSPVSWPLFAPFMKYNVRQALRDPAIGHVQVTRGRGRVERIQA